LLRKRKRIALPPPAPSAGRRGGLDGGHGLAQREAAAGEIAASRAAASAWPRTEMNESGAMNQDSR